MWSRGSENTSATHPLIRRCSDTRLLTGDPVQAGAEGADQAEFDKGKTVVLFEPGSLYELADPITYQSRVPYSPRYTELGRFKQAETTDDIL